MLEIERFEFGEGEIEETTELSSLTKSGEQASKALDLAFPTAKAFR